MENHSADNKRILFELRRCIIIDLIDLIVITLAPNGLRISRAALIDREDSRAKSSFQNRPILSARSGVACMRMLGRRTLTVLNTGADRVLL